MSEERAGGGADPAYRLGVRPSEVRLADLAHAGLDRGDRVIDLTQQLGTRDVAAAELSVAIADVSVLAEHVADEILKIAGEVKGEIAAGIRDAGQNFPETLIARVRLDLAAQRLELAGDDVGDPVLHQILPIRMATGQRAKRTDCGARPPQGPASFATRVSTGS